MQIFKKLIVCGDSYQTPSSKERYLNTHWSQILADKLGLELITLAHPGRSDSVISLQIKHAATYDDALTVISPGAGVRIEWCEPEYLTSNPIDHFSFKTPSNEYPNAFMNILPLSWCRIDHPMERVFLTNINPVFESYKQRCMIYYSLQLMKNRNRKFLFFNSIPGKKIPQEELLEIIDVKNLVTKQQLDIGEAYIDAFNASPEVLDLDPGYHTHPEFQVKLANYVEKRIQENAL